MNALQDGFSIKGVDASHVEGRMVVLINRFNRLFIDKIQLPFSIKPINIELQRSGQWDGEVKGHFHKPTINYFEII